MHSISGILLLFLELVLARGALCKRVSSVWMARCWQLAVIVTVLWLAVLATYVCDALEFKPRVGRLSVDYGPRKIGIAHANYLGVVQPYGVIANKGKLSEIAKRVVDLARQFSAAEIIVGIPVDSDGVVGHSVRNFNGRLCLNFSSVLSAVSSHSYPGKLATILFDERYTTKEAVLRLKTENIKGINLPTALY
jgi:RNase H-fold protein (predicted Holliday junction resolvase)